jgi:multidrug resistance efflux pump
MLRLGALCLAMCLFALARPATAQAPASAPTTQAVSVPATIEAFWSVDLAAKTSGYVSEIKADLGDHVSKGSPLALLWVPETEKSLAQAKAMLVAKMQLLKAAESNIAQAKQALTVAQKQLERDKVDLEYQQVTLKRQQELSAGKAITPQQLDEANAKAQTATAQMGISQAKLGAAEADLAAAEAGREVAKAQVAVAQAAVEQEETMLAYTRITAPFDGIVTRRMVNMGDLVQGGGANRGAPLFTLQQIDTVRVLCDVPELTAAGVKVGDKAEVKVYGLNNRTVGGTVTRLASALDPQTRTMRVEVDLKNADESLRPGMYAQVTLSVPAPAPHKP